MRSAVLLLADGKLTWYTARAAGLVAWGLCSASVVLGLASAGRRRRRQGVKPWLAGMHRYLATLTVVFTLVHLVALWLDDFVTFGLVELFVPMASSYRPGAVAWGIVATYALIAIQATSWVMHRLPRRLWRAVHMLSIVLFGAATVHGLTAGTDATNALVRGVGATTLVLVLATLVRRLQARASAVSPSARRVVEPITINWAETAYEAPRERIVARGANSDRWLARRLEAGDRFEGPARPRPTAARRTTSRQLDGEEVPHVRGRGLRALEADLGDDPAGWPSGGTAPLTRTRL